MVGIIEIWKYSIGLWNILYGSLLSEFQLFFHLSNGHTMKLKILVNSSKLTILLNNLFIPLQKMVLDSKQQQK